MTKSLRSANGPTIFGIALALLGPGAVAALTDRYLGTAQPLAIRSLGLAAFVILVAGVVAIAVRGERLTWAEVGFGRVSWASIVRAIGLTCFFVFIFGPLAIALLARLGLGSFDTGSAALASLPTWYLIVTIAIVAGGEEWLYRGYAIERLTAATGNIWIAGAISLLAFGAAHLPIWGLGPSLTTIVAGFVMTVLYIWSRDVSFLIVAHIAADLYGLVIAPSFPAGN